VLSFCQVASRHIPSGFQLYHIVVAGGYNGRIQTMQGSFFSNAYVMPPGGTHIKRATTQGCPYYFPSLVSDNDQAVRAVAPGFFCRLLLSEKA
jgi:hypothetical protein